MCSLFLCRPATFVARTFRKGTNPKPRPNRKRLALLPPLRGARGFALGLRPTFAVCGSGENTQQPTANTKSALLKFEWVTWGAGGAPMRSRQGFSPPLSPPPGAGQSSPPDGLGSQAQQGFARPEPSSVGVNQVASRVCCAGLRPPLTRPDSPTRNSAQNPNPNPVDEYGKSL
jgi:hypothetical protein